MTKKQRIMLMRIIISAVMLIGLAFTPVTGLLRMALYMVAYLTIGYDILRKAVSKIGIDRLLLGSDTPFGKNNVEKVMLRLNRIHLSKEEIEMITSKNMKKLLYLE